jgi:hypothetical protein
VLIRRIRVIRVPFDILIQFILLFWISRIIMFVPEIDVKPNSHQFLDSLNSYASSF